MFEPKKTIALSAILLSTNALANNELPGKGISVQPIESTVA